MKIKQEYSFTLNTKTNLMKKSPLQKTQKKNKKKISQIKFRKNQEP